MQRRASADMASYETLSARNNVPLRLLDGQLVSDRRRGLGDLSGR